MRRLVPAVPLLCLLAAAPALAAPAPAAEPSFRAPGSGIDAWAILGYGDGAGLGIAYHTPLVPEGFLRHGSGSVLRDSLDLDLGLDWVSYWGYRVNGYDYGWAQFDLHADVRWDLWLTPQFALYPKAGLGFGVGWYTGTWNSAYGDRRTIGGLYPEIALGAAWRWRRDLTLRAEVGYVGLKLGLGFEF